MTTTHTERSGPRRGESRLIGLLLLVGGGIWLLNETGVAAIGTKTILSVTLILLGLGMMALRPGAGRAPLAIAGIIISGILIFSPSYHRSGDPAVGDFLETPETVAELTRGFSVAAGSLSVDLTEVDLAGERPRVKIEVVLGEAKVLIPEDMTIRLEAKGLAGEVVIDGKHLQEGVGFDVRRLIGPGDEPDIVVVVEMTLGSVEVVHID